MPYSEACRDGIMTELAKTEKGRLRIAKMIERADRFLAEHIRKQDEERPAAAQGRKDDGGPQQQDPPQQQQAPQFRKTKTPTQIWRDKWMHDMEFRHRQM